MVLSDVDVVRNLGKGIVIYPLTKETISAGHVRLTASKYVYSFEPPVPRDELEAKDLEEKAFAFPEIPDDDDGNGTEIKIQPHRTILVVTKEKICLSDSFQGYCGLRFDLELRGLTSVGTPIKPGSAGALMVRIKNDTAEEQSIKVGERIAYVEISPLSTTPLNGVLDEGDNSNVKCSPRVYKILGQQGQDHLGKTGNCANLRAKMLGSAEYKAVAGEYETRIKETQKTKNIELDALTERVFLLEKNK